MALRISREVLELVYCRNRTFYKLHYGADRSCVFACTC